MQAKLYITISAIIAILYGIGFVLIPAKLIALYGGPPEPHAMLNIQFFGSALLAWGVIVWFAKDFQDWTAVRGVLIGSLVGQAVGALVTIWGISQGVVNSLAWSSVGLYVLLSVGALSVLFSGSHNKVKTHL